MSGRLRLEPGRWYACEFIGPEFAAEKDLASYSPIRVEAVQGHKSGDHRLRLGFHHANYPAGVQGKEYELTVLVRVPGLLIARSVDHQPVRVLQIYRITWEWMDRHFPGLPRREERETLDQWLTRVC